MARYADPLDDGPSAGRRGGWGFFARHVPSVSLAVLVAMLLTVVLWPYMIITVPSGHVGVLWYRFLGFDTYCWCFTGRGTVLSPLEIREEGLHVIAPWNKLFIYDLRLQSMTHTFNAISKDGVSVTATITVRYQLLHNSVGVLHKFVGPDYAETILSPEIGSEARQVISQYTAQEVYTSRSRIQGDIRDGAQKTLADKLNKLVQPAAMEEIDPMHYSDFLQNSILILDTLVLGIELPPEIVAAINRQTEQYYMIQEYKFRVEREAEESKRKLIEANGIAAFQKTVSQGISDSYLRWRGIEATLALAQSPNAKIVVIGTGRDGLPIILGNVDAPTPSGTSTPSGTPPPGRGSAPPPSVLAPGGGARNNSFDYPTTGFESPPAGSNMGAAEGGSGGADQRGHSSSNAASAADGASDTDEPNRATGQTWLNPLSMWNIQSVLSRIYNGADATESGSRADNEAPSKPGPRRRR
jgi:regulator of protease activity HflC (stomatin/prohibitin superfamily)